MKRSASHAGTWYSKDSKTLSDMLDKWLYEAAMDGTRPKSEGPIRAVIAPHAGLSYSGKTAAFAYAGVDPDAVSRVFVLGPSHHVYLDGCALSRCSVYETPLGDMNVDAASVALLKATGLFGDMDLAVDEEEHSIELHLPFIHKVMARKTNGPFQIVPILVGSLSPAKQALYGRILAPYLAASDSLFVVSSDFCHWGSRFRYTPHDPQTPIFKHIEALDRTGMDLIENLDVGGFTKYLQTTGNTICGRHPISLLLQTMAAIDMRKSSEILASDRSSFSIQFVRYAQSGQCLIPTDSSVSYASAICFMH